MALIADVFDVALLKDNGNIIATDTLTDASIDVKVDTKDVRGGRGNGLIGVLHSNRDITVKLADPEFRYEWLAEQLGQNIVTGAGVGYTMPKYYTATGTTTITITLDETPINGVTGLKVLDDTNATISEINMSITTKTITFSSGVEAGDVVRVMPYTYVTSASTEKIEIDITTFAKGSKLILETIEIDGDETPVAKLQYQFDEAVPTGSFTVDTKSERDASSSSVELRIVKPKNSTVIGRILRIPLS